MQNLRIIVVWLVFLGSGCLPSALQPRTSYEANPQALTSSGIVIFQDSSGALSYHAPVGRDVQKLVSTQRVRGRACQHGFQLPIAPLLAAATSSPLAAATSVSVMWADGGFREAMDEAVRRGVSEEAARDFILGHLNVELAILFDQLPGVRMSDAANKAVERAKKEIFVADWKKVFERDAIAENIRMITSV